jgi:glutamine amidotransferase-like uncharacterized protein
LSFIFLPGCEKDSPTENGLTPIYFDSVNVGLYIDEPVWPDLKIHTRNIIEELGFAYTILNNDSILFGNLTNYSVLILPGGRGDYYYNSLGWEGLSNIRNYVSRGGGYIGICGTSFIAARTGIWRGWAGEPRIYQVSEEPLHIFQGIVDGPVEDFAPTYRDVNCQIKITNHQHPVSHNLPDTMVYVYDHGPMFLIEGDDHATVLGETVKGSHAFIITTEYNYGRVFLSTGHPEVTNDVHCRQLFKNAINWCSKQD